MPKKTIKATLDEIETRIVASDTLSDEEKSSALARAREHVEKARKEKAVDAYFKAAVKEVERSHTPAEQYEDFEVNLPEYTWQIKLDNVGYYHGCTYEVPYSVARSMADIQYNAWSHDREIQGRRRHGDISRQPLYTNLSPNAPQGRVTNTGNMAAPRHQQ